MTVRDLRRIVASIPSQYDDLPVLRDSCTRGYDGVWTLTDCLDWATGVRRTVVELE